MASTTHIVLVDDDPAHRKLIRRALAKAGIPHPVTEAASVEQARALLLPARAAAVQPAALIVDVNLTDGRGTSLVAELRGEPAYSAVPVLVLSTSALQSDIDESYAKGATGYLIKSQDPVTFSLDMAREIRALLERAPN